MAVDYRRRAILTHQVVILFNCRSRELHTPRIVVSIETIDFVTFWSKIEDHQASVDIATCIFRIS